MCSQASDSYDRIASNNANSASSGSEHLLGFWGAGSRYKKYSCKGPCNRARENRMKPSVRTSFLGTRPSCLPSPGALFFCTDDRKPNLKLGSPETGSPVISQNGSCVPNDVLNWLISKMVWVKLWYWNFELTSSWSFFLQSSEILSFCIPLLTSENFFNGCGGVYTAAIRVTTKTVTCHSNSFLCIAVYFAARAPRRACSQISDNIISTNLTHKSTITSFRFRWSISSDVASRYLTFAGFLQSNVTEKWNFLSFSNKFRLFD